MFQHKLTCQKCGSTCIAPHSNGTRCNQCGFQMKGIVPGFEPPKYLPRELPRRQNIRRSLSDQDKAAYKQTWETLKHSRVTIPENTLKASIIIPTYKRQHSLFYTLASILSQTYTNLEIVIIDNEKNSNYKFSNKRIKYFQHAEEQGASYARNKGLEYATGDLVCFMDDDDIMLPEYLEKMVAPFRDVEVKCVSCNILLVENEIPPHKHFCTPTILMRREYATPTWGKDGAHDKHYFNSIIGKLPKEYYVEIDDVLIHAYTESVGGLRGAGADL